MTYLSGRGAVYPTYKSVFVEGATGDGATDDTAAIQATIDNAPDGGTVLLPTGTFKITAALEITKDITILGSGVAQVSGGAAVSGFGNYTATSPYLQGSVLLPSTAGQNGIEITGTGNNVHLRDFGIRFADAIMFDDTGHGIYSVPSATVSGAAENGIFNSRWDNLHVFGHDGDHYAYYMQNMMLGTFSHLRGQGGGGLHIESYSNAVHYGNSVFVHPYFVIHCGGTAHGYHLVSEAGGGTHTLALCSFIRPQCNVVPLPGPFSGTGASNPSVAQYMWLNVDDPDRVSIYDPDLEGYTYSNPVDFGGDGINVMVRPGGLIGGPAPSTYPFSMERMAADVNAGDGLTVTPGAGAGVATGGTASTPFTNSDRGCLIRIATGTAPAGAGNLICSVAFGVDGDRNSIVLQATDAAVTQSLGLFTYGLASTGFDVYAVNAMAPSTTYDFFFAARKVYS